MEVFMDDFSVYGKTFDDCLENLDEVLQRFEEKHLVLNWKKYHFMVREGIVLGHFDAGGFSNLLIVGSKGGNNLTHAT